MSPGYEGKPRLGSGAGGLGLAGGSVSEAQMRALFGKGRHPNRDAMLAAGMPLAATRLGSGFPQYGQLPPRSQRISEATAVFEAEYGRPPTAPETQRMTAREARQEGRPGGRFGPGVTPGEA